MTTDVQHHHAGRHHHAGARRSRRRATTALVSVTLLVAGCTAAPPEDDGGTSTPTASPSADATVQELPDTPAGGQAAWVLEQMGAEADTSAQDAAERFSAEFLDTIPTDTLLGIFDQLRAAAPWTPVDVEHAEPSIRVTLTSDAQDLVMDLQVDGDGQIAGLFFSEPPPPRDPATSWDALVEEVDGMAARTSLLVATVSADGRCVPREGMPAGSAAGEQLPVGSMFKLYVLGAVVDAVGSGDLAWTTPLTVSDVVRSLPSGRLQDEPSGTVVTVQEAAELMISLSDNTATDLLIHAVGRAAVEQAMAEMGHSDPEVNLPLPTTRELFWIGWGGAPELRERWAAADEEGRRAILEEAPTGPLDVDTSTMASTVVWPSDVDWFATAEDLCAAHVALAELASTPHGAPVAEIMSANPGIDVDEVLWPYVAFKGGSSVATMGGSWYARREDGEVVVVVFQTAADDVGDAVTANTLAGVAEDALRLAGED